DAIERVLPDRERPTSLFDAERLAEEVAGRALAFMRSEGWYAATVEPKAEDAPPRAQVQIQPGARFAFAAPEVRFEGVIDDASAAALMHVVRTKTSKVIVTVRSGEPSADAVQALWKDDLLNRLDLQPLGRRDVEQLAGAVLGGAVEPSTVQRLHTATGGNLLLLRELLFATTDSGALASTGGVWRWTPGALESPRLTELVEARIGYLREEERLALELIALGEPLELALLIDIAGREPVAALESAGLITSSRDGNRSYVRLHHPIYASVIVESLPPVRANGHRLTLANAVDRVGARRRNDVLRSTTWRLEAGEMPSLEVAVRAAAMANRLFDAPLAARLSEVALRAGGGLEAAVAYATAAVEQSRFADAVAALSPHRVELMTFEQALVYLPLVIQALGGLAGADDGLELLDRLVASDAYAQDRRVADLVSAMRANVHMRRREWDAVLHHGMPLLDGDDVDERVMLHAVNPVTMTLVLQGRTDTCLRVGEKAIEPALRLLDELPDALGWAASARVTAMLYAGRFDELNEFLQAVYEDALARGDDALIAQTTVGLGSSCLSRGLCQQAIDWLSKAAAVLRQGDPDGFAHMCLALLAEAQVYVGAIEGAKASLAEAARLPTLYATQSSTTLIVEARLATMEGDFVDAPKRLAAAAREGGFPPVEEVQILHHAIRMGLEDHDAYQRLDALAKGSEAACMQAWGAHARALLDGTGAALEAVAQQFGAMSMWLVAAECAAQASAAYRQEGLLDSARRAAALSQSSFARAEALPTQVLVHANAPAVLSKREREVALLAAKGMSNSDIAAQLVLSIRTVESHLYRVFDKLGVDRREDLAGLL
ncbi:MAG: helix-turn-helix transcriptional regulator, partial [Acidimicrobiales bacterium]|nr:helix-turn-helix transcriptional regulator [Acidimicrobiales bacterium]